MFKCNDSNAIADKYQDKNGNTTLNAVIGPAAIKSTFNPENDESGNYGLKFSVKFIIIFKILMLMYYFNWYIQYKRICFIFHFNT